MHTIVFTARRGTARRLVVTAFATCLLLASLPVAGFPQAKEPAAPALPFKEVLTVPEGTPEETVEFFQNLKRRRPEFDTQEQALAHAKRVFETIAAASGKLLAGELDPDLEEKVTAAHFEALAVLNGLGDARAEAPMLALAQKLKGHKNQELSDYARLQLLQTHVNGVMDDKPGSADALVAEVKDYAAGGRPTGQRFDTVRTVARVLEMQGEYDRALETYGLLRETFLKSASPDLMTAADDTAKAAQKRIGVVGKKVELQGTTVGGQPFDLAQHQGKVTLIDFWATWCGPCRAELPNIKQNYEKYHDRGFEVVGISLDEDRGALERFLRDAEIPWTTLFSDNPQTTQALADRFGVEGIPAMLLVGRDGKVVTLKARGEDLGKQLERLLGPAEGAAPSQQQ